MKRLFNLGAFDVRSWKVALFLVVIVPVGLLATFRLTGVLHEPLTPETITVDAVSWNMNRPAEYVILNEIVRNSYVDGAASANLSFIAWTYCEDELSYPYYNKDHIKSGIIATVNVSEGFVYSVIVRFSMSDVYAFLDIIEDPDFVKLDNLVKKEISNNINSCEALLKTVAVNEASYCSLEIWVFWIFLDQNSADHLVTVDLEVTYFNGSVYKRVIVPIMLEVVIG